MVNAYFLIFITVVVLISLVWGSIHFVSRIGKENQVAKAARLANPEKHKGENNLGIFLIVSLSVLLFLFFFGFSDNGFLNNWGGYFVLYYILVPVFLILLIVTIAYFISRGIKERKIVAQ